MVATAFAKLAGIRKGLQLLLDQTTLRRERPIENFSSKDAGDYFKGAREQIGLLRERLPDFFADFPEIDTEPSTKMSEGSKEPSRFGRDQLLRLARALDQVFEIRANSELATPAVVHAAPRAFLSHGAAGDWREVQAYIEKDAGIATLELAQQPNLGRTVLEKLDQESKRCTSAVIVMTGDDLDAEGKARVRENVMHEIGYLQGRLGHSAVCLLHEEGVNIPSNIHGLVYIPFPRGRVSAAFGVLRRELDATYRRR